MSGTLISIVLAIVISRSEQQAADVAELCGEERCEARGERAIDHAMVVRQRQRQDQPWREFLAVPDRLGCRLGDAEDRHFRRIDDRREAGATDTAERGDREAATGHLGWTELLVARLLRNLAQLAGKIEQALLV